MAITVRENGQSIRKYLSASSIEEIAQSKFFEEKMLMTPRLLMWLAYAKRTAMYAIIVA